MDPFYNKTVTLYNRYEDDDGEEHWYPTVLENVRLQITKGANVTTSGLDTADTAKLFVKKTGIPKEYRKPLQWQSEEEKEKYFTFAEGSDFFVEGDTSESQITDDFFATMKAIYDDCYLISNVDVYDLIPHWEVGGK